MKVLVLTTTFPRWKDDTTPSFVYELSKQLKDEGMDIFVLAPHYEGAKFEEEMNGLKIYRFPYFYPTKYQRLCYEGGILPNLKRSWVARIQVPLLFLSELIYAARIVRNEKIDAIHVHWIVPNGLVAAIINRLWHIHFVSTAHAADVLALDKLPLKTKISSFILQNSYAVTTDGSYIKERLLCMLPIYLRSVVEKKILVQPMGVDIKMFEGLIRDKIRKKYKIHNEFIILFVGRFAEKKGLEYLLEAMKIITSYPTDTNLLLVGTGPLEDKLTKKVKELNLTSNVHFMGWANKEKLAEFYVLSDIVVVPSIVTDSGDTEGMPTVIVEAMATGKPVVASDVSGIKDVVIDGFNGLLVEQKNPKMIAEKIAELINNPSLHGKFSQNAIFSSKKSNWTIIGKKFAGLIRGEL